jgi:hypothetical protein
VQGLRLSLSLCIDFEGSSTEDSIRGYNYNICISPETGGLRCGYPYLDKQMGASFSIYSVGKVKMDSVDPVAEGRMYPIALRHVVNRIVLDMYTSIRTSASLKWSPQIAESFLRTLCAKLSLTWPSGATWGPDDTIVSLPDSVYDEAA